MLPGYETFDPLNEVLRMLRCGFGLKDAPRLWHKVLREHLIALGLRPLQSDAQIYVWHVAAGRGESKPAIATYSGDVSLSQRLVLIVSTHVDDLKGAGEETYRKKLLDGLTSRFSALKTNVGKFECIGVVHEQNEATIEVCTHTPAELRAAHPRDPGG